MEIQNIPRIRGRLAQFAEPEEWKDKWCFEITFWSFDGEHQYGEPIGPFGPFETEAEASVELKKAARMASETCEMKMTGEISGKFIDMKNGGILRPWEEN